MMVESLDSGGTMWFSSWLWNTEPALDQVYTLHRVQQFAKAVNMCLADL